MDAVRIRVASPITVFSYDICSDLKMMLIMIDMVHIWNNEGVHDGQYCINRNIDDDDDAEMSQPEEEDNNKKRIFQHTFSVLSSTLKHIPKIIYNKKKNVKNPKLL